MTTLTEAKMPSLKDKLLAQAEAEKTVLEKVVEKVKKVTKKKK